MSNIVLEVYVEGVVVAQATSHEAAEAAKRLLQGEGLAFVRYAPRRGGPGDSSPGRVEGKEPCQRCGGTREDPEHVGPCGECSPRGEALRVEDMTLRGTLVAFPKECGARMGSRTCHKPQGHEGPHRDVLFDTWWSP